MTDGAGTERAQAALIRAFLDKAVKPTAAG